MKLILIPAIVLGVTLAISPSAEAAKGDKSARVEKRAGKRMLSRFDANRDGSLDTNEAQRVRTAYQALKNLDTDKNGELSDSEITAAKIPKRKGKRAK